jgi:CheY-like chemotaxis protein
MKHRLPVQNILLIDDEPYAHLSILAQVDEGCTAVHCANDCNSAIEIFNKLNGQFDVVLCDFRLPGVNEIDRKSGGMDFYEYIRPELRRVGFAFLSNSDKLEIVETLKSERNITLDPYVPVFSKLTPLANIIRTVGQVYGNRHTEADTKRFRRSSFNLVCE